MRKLKNKLHTLFYIFFLLVGVSSFNTLVYGACEGSPFQTTDESNPDYDRMSNKCELSRDCSVGKECSPWGECVDC